MSKIGKQIIESLEELNDKLAAVNAVAELRAQLADRDRQIAAASEELALFRDQLAEKDRHIAALREELAAARDSHKATIEVLDNRTNAFDKCYAELDAARAALKKISKTEYGRYTNSRGCIVHCKQCSAMVAIAAEAAKARE